MQTQGLFERRETGSEQSFSFASLAQQAERTAVNRDAAGSIPARSVPRKMRRTKNNMTVLGTEERFDDPEGAHSGETSESGGPHRRVESLCARTGSRPDTAALGACAGTWHMRQSQK